MNPTLLFHVCFLAATIRAVGSASESLNTALSFSGDNLGVEVHSVTSGNAMQVLQKVCEAHRYDLIPELMSTKEFLKGVGGTRKLVSWAVANGHPEAARAIVNSFEDRQDLLERACRKGYVDVVSVLLEDPEFNPGANEQAALLAACKMGHVQIVDLLCQSPLVDPSPKEKWAPVTSVILNDRYELLRYIMTCPRSKEFIPEGSRRPIYNAMRNGKLESLCILMEADQISHSKLTGNLLKHLKIDITQLSPDAVKASIAGDLEALKLVAPNPFHSMDEIDVLLGLARKHPHLVSYLKERQLEHLKNISQDTQIVLHTFKDQFSALDLIRVLENKEPYNFLTSSQFKFLINMFYRNMLGDMNTEALSQLLTGLATKGFKKIDP